jgi:hypothetical protein
MALFGRNKKLDEDEAASEVLPPFPRRQTQLRALVEVEAEPRVETPAPRPRAVEKKGFGIDEAVRLLRRLRDKNHTAVREAVHQMMELLEIDVARIVVSADAKDAQIATSIDRLRVEIERHEALMLAGKKQIAQHENEREELTAAKKWLLAEHNESEPIPLVPFRSAAP